MNRIQVTLAIGLLVVWAAWPATSTTADEPTRWRPEPAPLASRWAKQVSPAHVWPEYPRPQMVRSQWQSLNGLWELKFASDALEPPFGETLPERVLVPFPIESSLSGIRRRAERVWYRREFEVPQRWSGKRILLHFGAVDWEATVYVNGQKVGRHRGGFDPFQFDITDQLTGEGPQELLVAVFDPSDDGPQPRGKQVKQPTRIHYTPCTGIWQSVWIEPVSAVRIERLHTTADVSASCAWLLVEGEGTSVTNTVEATVHLDGEPVVHAFGGVGAEIRLVIPPEKLRTWSPDDPHLYGLTVALRQGEVSVDQVESYFALRELGTMRDAEGRTRLTLGGEPIFQVGVLDQGYWPAGIYTAPTDEALRADIVAAKRLGFNTIRKHVKVEPQRWYYWCDRLGMLVWQDIPSGENDSPAAREQFAREMRRIVESRGRHPSIVGWVIFNEGWGQHETEQYVERLRRWDPNRWINAASGWTDRGVGDVIDRHAYPGPPDVAPNKNRAAMIGEFGGIGLAVPGHRWLDGCWSYRTVPNSAQLTARYESLMRKAWQMARHGGLSAAIYTQLTDVESECNGLLTYDRAIVKVEASRIEAANWGMTPKIRAVVPTARTEPAEWRYTFEQPPAAWIGPEFDESSWQKGPSGFGRPEVPEGRVGTPWRTADIWLRRVVTLPPLDGEDLDPAKLRLMVHHDEDVEVYLNGVLALAAGGYTVDYRPMPIRPDALETLRAGKNLIAVHCRNREGDQYIDVGLAEVTLVPAD